MIMGSIPPCQGDLSHFASHAHDGILPTMTVFHDNLRRLMEERGFKAAQLSKAAGKSATLVRDLLERTSNPKHDTLVALASVLGCSVNDLVGDEPSTQHSARPPAPSAISRIPEVDVRGGMGGGGVAALEINHTDEWGNQIARDDVRGTWDMPTDYLRHELRVVPARVQIIEVRGDSMEPTLSSGDRVMIDLDDVDPGPGGVFAVWDGMSVLVKRIERVHKSDPPAVRVVSDNVHHSPFELVLDDGGGRIIGRAVWFGRRM